MKEQVFNSLLHLCSTIWMHREQRQLLVAACREVNNWDDLLHQAEYHGLAPLLHHHVTAAGIDVDVPDTFIRGLRLLSLRHKQANRLLLESLQQILSLLAKEGIRCLVLKGAALSQMVYPDNGLRPMRDIDLLLAKKDVYRAHELLKNEQYHDSGEVLPQGYYHLSPLFRNVDGMRVCVELHHGLFPNDPPYYEQLDFTELYNNRQEFDAGGVKAYTLAGEEMLWHLFQHGFHAPLTYESFRLISVADIVSLVEARMGEVDWIKVGGRYPEVLNALPLLHHITPWSENVLAGNVFRVEKSPAGVGRWYSGWPRKNPQQKEDNFPFFLLSTWNYVSQTLYPGQWWSMLYYGHAGGLGSSLLCRLVQHPMHVLRWVKVYVRKLFKGKPTKPVTPLPRG